MYMPVSHVVLAHVDLINALLVTHYLEYTRSNDFVKYM